MLLSNVRKKPTGVKVQVVLAERERCVTLTLHARPGETVADMIRRSGVLGLGLGFDPLRVEGAIGIFGQSVAPDVVPRDGDRIEIYRPLKRDPMEARRRSAAGGS